MMKNNFINKNIYTYLKGILKKFEFSSEDLELVEKINISAFDMGNNFISNSLEDLKKFPNLKKLEISKFILNKDNINIIKNLFNLEDYAFLYTDIKDKCDIKGKSILLVNCQKIYNININFKNVVIENCNLNKVKINCEKIILNNCTDFENSYINMLVNEIEFKNMNFNDNESKIILNLALNTKIKINNCKYKNNIFDNIKNINVINGVEGEYIE